MKQERMTKAALLEELDALRRHNTELRAVQAAHQRAEEALRKREERLEAVFKAVSDAIVTLDLGGTITEASRATEAITGYSREELIGKFFGYFHTPESAALAHERTNKALRGERMPSIFEQEVVRKDGRFRWRLKRVSCMRVESQSAWCAFFETSPGVSGQRQSCKRRKRWPKPQIV